MSTFEESTAVTTGEELEAMVASQRAAFLSDPFPSLAERQELLRQLAAMVMINRSAIEEAMSADFGVHPMAATDMIEVLGVAGRAGYAAERLEGWMAPEPRDADPALYGSGRAFVQPQPKGVVGNISPWNFPFDLSLGPLVEMLAAGNRVILKPSEHSPACSELLREVVHATFEPSRVDVAVGGLELAQQFVRVRWDHLLYTGSPAVGRQIAIAAAEQLVPVTLELGGKCPAILTEDSVDPDSVRQVLGTKAVKSGQMCISIDYCLVPRDRLEDFARLAADQAREKMPEFTSSESNTGIIDKRHLGRIRELTDEAVARGADVRTLEEGGVADPERRQLPLTLVLDPPEDLALMREEIFGPVLPVVPYDRVEEAIDFVNEGERPLALYVFSKDDGVAEEVLLRTTSGGACVNTAAVHGALPSLPFGGSGQSGYGRHHGVEGFREFSNPRGVFVRGEEDLLEAFMPPYGEIANAVVNSAFQQAGAGGPVEERQPSKRHTEIVD